VTSTDRIPALPGPGTRAAIDARKSTDYEFTATATYGELLSGVVAGLAPPRGGVAGLWDAEVRGIVFRQAA
jgi:hypothetical protein